MAEAIAAPKWIITMNPRGNLPKISMKASKMWDVPLWIMRGRKMGYKDIRVLPLTYTVS